MEAAPLHRLRLSFISSVVLNYMFTLAQVAAIVGLLLAFGAPQKQVDTVQSILEGQQTVQEAPAIGGVGAPVEIGETSSYPIVGTTTQGWSVYRGFGLFTIDPKTGCQRGVVNQKNNAGLFYVVNAVVINCSNKK